MRADLETYRAARRETMIVREGIFPPGWEVVSKSNFQCTTEGPDEGIVKVTLQLHLRQVRVMYRQGLKNTTINEFISRNGGFISSKVQEDRLILPHGNMTAVSTCFLPCCDAVPCSRHAVCITWVPHNEFLFQSLGALIRSMYVLCNREVRGGFQYSYMGHLTLPRQNREGIK